MRIIGDGRPKTPRTRENEKPLDMKSLRELANMNARTAINTHLKKQAGNASLRALMMFVVGLVAVSVFSWRHVEGDWYAAYAGLAAVIMAGVMVVRYLESVRRLRGKRLPEVDQTSTPNVADEPSKSTSGPDVGEIA
jgi:uncharacterized membrane-anchored protein